MSSSTAHAVRPIGDADAWRPFAADIAHPAPFVCGLSVGKEHVSDVVAHVNNIEMVRWLDRAAELHADAGGFTRQRLLDAGIMWFVARHEIDYLAEAWPDDALLISTWIRRQSRVKAWRDSVVHRRSDSTVICRASTLWVLVNLETRRPTRIPVEMNDFFQPLELDKPTHDASQPCTSH